MGTINKLHMLTN